MTDLFMKRDEIASGLFRYWLTRVWDISKPRLVVKMLNPSIGDGHRDDQTILRLIHFAKAWGYGGLIIVNFYAYRTSSPTEMWMAARNGLDITGPHNRQHVANAVEYAANLKIPILAAWGNGASNDHWMSSNFYTLVTELHVPLICLGTTKDGSPKHPMARGRHRIANDQRPILWSAA